MAQLGSAEIEALSHVQSLVEAFKAFDADNDGKITTAELSGIMGSLGYSPSEQDVKAMMQQGDTNRDGLLSIQEFIEMNTKELELGSLATSLKAAFDALDVEEDETLTGVELHEVMGTIGITLSLEDCQNLIDSLDVDGDGAVNIEESKLLINSLL
ncbi:hypothetical protein L1049_026760 [Liquidambar formosana]|uniref:EF-hand domain-containing protein n=1 Tax=Liquidambar formosana TaxID=63359 RepID=A0AAP0R925_LIQFO